MTKRKKKDAEAPAKGGERESVTTRTAIPAELIEQALVETARESERAILAHPAAESLALDDVETTVNVAGDALPFPGRDDLDEPTVTVAADALAEVDSVLVHRRHLRGLLEALVFASDSPIKAKELAKLASAQVKLVMDLLEEIKQDFSPHGIHLEEVAGGWVFRTSAQYAPFIRDLTKQRPVRLTRAQVETLAIIAYRQPITRPEVDDVRGVDSGPVLKLLLERDLVRILGKRDEVGRPLIYGTTNGFLEFFGLKSLKDLPTLREFTELTEESREKYEDEMGEPPNDAAPPPDDGGDVEHDTDGHGSLRGPMPTAVDFEEPPMGLDDDTDAHTGRPVTLTDDEEAGARDDGSGELDDDEDDEDDEDDDDDDDEDDDDDDDDDDDEDDDEDE